VVVDGARTASSLKLLLVLASVVCSSCETKHDLAGWVSCVELFDEVPVVPRSLPLEQLGALSGDVQGVEQPHPAGPTGKQVSRLC
jgi:hypothetical protein